MNIGRGVKSVILKDNKFLVLVKPDGSFDLPGGRVETGELLQEALYREIAEETGLEVKIFDPISEWQFLKQSNLLVKGFTYLCGYIGGKIELCNEHIGYFWVEADTLNAGDFIPWVDSVFFEKPGNIHAL
jgi:8-oxo-dGTP pyrophosphatase MutT (NUDIX family)